VGSLACGVIGDVFVVLVYLLLLVVRPESVIRRDSQSKSTIRSSVEGSGGLESHGKVCPPDHNTSCMAV
jgi:hypothetical protein